jgi:hypothetical protein
MCVEPRSMHYTGAVNLLRASEEVSCEREN